MEGYDPGSNYKRSISISHNIELCYIYNRIGNHITDQVDCLLADTHHYHNHNIDIHYINTFPVYVQEQMIGTNYFHGEDMMDKNALSGSLKEHRVTKNGFKYSHCLIIY